MILITGASGLLGSNLVLTGVKAGREIAALTHDHPIHLDGVESVRVDLTDTPAVNAVVAKLRPSAVIHCAAMTNIDDAERSPEAAMRINGAASGALAEAAANVGARFVYVSTDTVFDGTRKFSSETDEVRPLNVYGRTKLAGEHASLRLNPNTIVARTNLYGWNALPKQSLAEWVLESLERGETVPGFTDVFFCPFLVNDLAESLFAMVDRNLTGIYHVVGSERISKHDFAARVARRFGLDESKVLPASVQDAALSAPRVHELSLSTDKIAGALGRKMPGVDKGLERFAALRDNGFRTELRAMVTTR
ncbi:MAG: SDR family oxidoreductase [Gemmatimonadota bacterium]|nr:SDR family oxidoreductase [Gemmatimonadota bacterium]